ncbi:MAG: bifunctional phosphoribosylaminoimidazolecarboxamide formyltransferase/IMP cyclohydrolase [Thermoanaerobaculia bacterium]|nr:MAG: bifunctional phosphoribosylaminoimidazolecarboxamide formyltransferase/IMP cyclohydrolase [Thermoanaerobaculia bacterium]MBZ0102985.1 bifunctional phosphoribosylaminoimidazolecarboxamide formyltransferase/IMP cyclohydrolase [Thermoanaerobaculia bacterium]
MLPARRALLSVSDKSGLVDFARGLAELGIELLSTGGTARHLREAGLPVTPVADVTGFPEILDGRVKTLHPAIHGGLLADRARPEHLASLEEHAIGRIDVVAVNLYPFRQTVADPGAGPGAILEMIDIGGPSMVRSAAKNFSGVAVVVDPFDYPQVLDELRRGGGVVELETRRALARKAFGHTSAYDAAIAAWFASQTAEADDFPALLSIDLERELVPRYGENPHQGAAVYRTIGGPGVLAGMTQLQGKELSWNNLLDADAARRLVALVAEPGVVIVKHNNPCGVGRGDDLPAAFRRALACDPVSAFGSIVALNRPLDGETVDAMADLFVEVLIAPAADEEALARLSERRNLRLLVAPPYEFTEHDIELRAIDGGFLAQNPDGRADDPAGWTSPTRRPPSGAERRALELAWSVCRYVKSNAIVVANGEQTVGIGAGQMSRVDSCRLAVAKAVLPVAGCVAASDAFFPFADGLEVLAEAGITAVVQPGGSKRDEEVVAAADRHGLAMLLTGTRHFRH